MDALLLSFLWNYNDTLAVKNTVDSSQAPKFKEIFMQVHVSFRNLFTFLSRILAKNNNSVKFLSYTKNDLEPYFPHEWNQAGVGRMVMQEKNNNYIF